VYAADVISLGDKMSTYQMNTVTFLEANAEKINEYMRFEVLKVVRMIMFFWVVTPCRLVDRYQNFGKTYCLHLQG
jgi:hypothetical protein